MNVSFTAADRALATQVMSGLIGALLDPRSTAEAAVAGERPRLAAIQSARDDLIRTRAAADAYRSATAIAAAQPAIGSSRPATRRARRSIPDRIAANAGETEDAGQASPLRRLEDDRLVLAAGLMQIRQRYGADHPTALAVQARLDSIEASIRAASPPTPRRATIAVPSSASPATTGTAARSFADLARERDRLSSLADAAAARYRSLATVPPIDRIGPTGPRLQSFALASSAWSWQRLIRFAALGLLSALVLAALLIAVLELLTPGFRTARQAARMLGIPVLGTIPEMTSDGAHGPRRHPDAAIAASAMETTGAFGELHDSLGLGTSQASQVIAVSSALASEGKTTVSVTLARRAARTGLRTLLIDCDMRRPAATKLLAPEVGAGLVEVLRGEVELGRALACDAASGAWFLGISAGAVPVNDLLSSRAMGDLVTEAMQRFDVILLDLAPTLALVETRFAAAFADRVLFVTRWRKTPIKAVRIALDLLREAGSGSPGLVLTRVYG